MHPLRRLLRWLGSHELAVLLGFVGIAGGIWLFAAIADEVVEGGTQGFDRRVLLSMRRPSDLAPIGPIVLQEAARDVTALGGATVLGILTLITGGFLWLVGKRHMGLLVFAAVGSGLLISTILKDLFHRARPDIVPHADAVFTTSFPSGHSMLSAVTYLTLGALLARSQERRRVRAFVLLVAAFLTFIVGLSRVYLGVHWPTDVLAGWTAGASWAVVCWLVARVLQKRHAIEGEVEQRPDEPG